MADRILVRAVCQVSAVHGQQLVAGDEAGELRRAAREHAWNGHSTEQLWSRVVEKLLTTTGLLPRASRPSDCPASLTTFTVRVAKAGSAGSP